MSSFKDDLVSLFHNDKNYKTVLTLQDKNRLKSMWTGIDPDRVIAFNFSKGIIKKQSVVFMKTGVRVNDSFYSLLGLESIEKNGSSYLFKYVDETATFKISDDIVVYLKKMLEVIHKYESLGHTCISINERDKALSYYNETIGYDYPYNETVLTSTALGYYNKEKYVLSYAYLMKSIELKLNLVYAYYLLGFLYRYGKGVEKDLDKTLEYFDKGLSIDSRDSNICCDKAHLYYYDLDKKDEALAILLKAKDQTRGSVVKGLCYRNGYGCEVSISESNEVFLNMIKRGDKIGYYYLINNMIQIKDHDRVLKYIDEYGTKGQYYHYLYGKLYFYGVGVERDIEKAYKHFEKHEDMYEGDVNALYYIGRIFYDLEEYEMAYHAFKEIHDQNKTSANYYLADMYREGLYVERSKEKYIELLKQGVDNNDCECMVGLAYYYLEHGNSENEIFDLLKKAVKEEVEDHLAIDTYILFFKEGFGVKYFADMKDHFEFIREIYDKRGKWFENSYREIKKYYVNTLVRGLKVEKKKDVHDKKEKAIYIYSTKRYHAFLILSTLDVVEVWHDYVDFQRTELGAYYTVRYDNYGLVDTVIPRTRIDDMLDLY